jgi:hypothetical protein
VTVALRVTVAPAVTGFGIALRTVVVCSTPGTVVVLGELEPPQPRRKRKPVKAMFEAATRIKRVLDGYICPLEQ